MKITVIGAAGCIGSAAAFYIAANGLANEIIMIDPQENLLLHHAMDLGTAVSDQDTIIRTGNFSDMTGTDIVINAAGAHQALIASRMEMLPKNLTIVQDIAREIFQYCPEAVMITATNPVDPLNYATYLLSPGRDRSRFIGYSRNDSARFRMMVAQALGVRNSRTEGTVIGEHGASQVLLFSSVRVNKKRVSIGDDIKQEIRKKVPNILRSYEELKTGRTAGWTSAIGLAAVARAIIRNTGDVIPCSAVLSGEYGCQGLSMGVPAVIGQGGIHEILEWDLAPDEQEGLKGTINALQPAMKYVEEHVGKAS
ncbi:MAG: hypothetical protein A2144_08160 [Chloroflexi bacterium RBG_16_50_9]|nr:MAG: hypothetical protein A2144_08160 [Chloroflexi bacterium RBG_16_50_9]